ncbi:ribokinase [Aquamicrobium terrae]
MIPVTPSKTLTVFGGISLDTMVRAVRLPQPDEKLWVDSLGDFCGGMGANAAVCFSMLGGKSILFGAVGTDQAGRQCIAQLEEAGVDTSNVCRDNGSTFRTFAILGPDGEKAMLLLSAADMAGLTHFPYLDLVASHDLVHVAPGRASPPVSMLQGWRERGIGTSADIEPAMLDRGLEVAGWLSACSIVFCGRAAAGRMTGLENLDGCLTALLERGPDIVVITKGRDGASLACKDGQRLHEPGVNAFVVDSTGAGDAFAGAFLAALAAGRSLDACLQLSNKIAALTTTVYGSRLTSHHLAPFIADLAMSQ